MAVAYLKWTVDVHRTPTTALPNELINDKLKDCQGFVRKLKNGRQNMKSLQTIASAEAKKLDVDIIRNRIRDLPKILRTIEAE